MSDAFKPLGRKSYGHIGHLPGSRLGEGDHHVHEGQARCMTVELPRKDRLIVEEKLDGSNVGICKVDGKIHAIGRAGWTADSSPYEQHKMFAAWVHERADSFASWLPEGWRICGEWLALAHGTKYADLTSPFIAFDIIDDKDQRLTRGRFWPLADVNGLSVPHVFHVGTEACPIERVAEEPSRHGAVGPKEGVVYRWERGDRVLMLAKWVRPDKVDLVPEVGNEHWNWRAA